MLTGSRQRCGSQTGARMARGEADGLDRPPLRAVRQGRGSKIRNSIGSMPFLAARSLLQTAQC
jgi:hypothetical protein